MTDYRSPLLDLPRAVPAPDGALDAGVPWHFGDPFAEQRAAQRQVVVVDRSHREVISVTGQDRLSWLHLVLSQHVTELADGAGTEALVLDSQGRVDTHTVLAHADETVLLDTDPEPVATSAREASKQPLLEYLQSMIFLSKVEPVDVTAELAVLSVLGPGTGDTLTAVGIDPPAADYQVTATGGVLARRMPWPVEQAVDLLVPRAELGDWWSRLTGAGARQAGSMAFDALRTAAQRPRVGVDTDDRTLPHEVGWIGVAAHVAKGCYRGQETVAKVHNVGRPPRRLLLLHLDGSPEVRPEQGDPVVSAGNEVGRVGSVALHHELGPIALALVKRTVPVEAELLAGTDDHVVQAAIDPDSVPPDTAAPGREAIKRLRG